MSGCTLWFSLQTFNKLLDARHLIKENEIVGAYEEIPGLQVQHTSIPHDTQFSCVTYAWRQVYKCYVSDPSLYVFVCVRVRVRVRVRARLCMCAYVPGAEDDCWCP